jgi:hypothetical protein
VGSRLAKKEVDQVFRGRYVGYIGERYASPSVQMAFSNALYDIHTQPGNVAGDRDPKLTCVALRVRVQLL